MPSRSSATAFDRLAPDQRAAVELVLRQGRSYGELVRPARDARGDDPRPRPRRPRRRSPRTCPPPRALGRDRRLAARPAVRGPRGPHPRAAAGGPGAPRRWAATVAEPLRAVPGGEPCRRCRPAPSDEPRVNGKSARRDGAAARRRRRAATRGGAPRRATAARRARGGRARAAPPRRAARRRARPRARAPRRRRPPPRAAGSSRLGGALLIGAAVVLVRGRARRSSSCAAATTTRVRSPTRRSRPRPPPRRRVGARPTTSCSRAPRARRRSALMRLFQANDGTVRFAIAAQGVDAQQDRRDVLAVVPQEGRRRRSCSATSRTR